MMTTEQILAVGMVVSLLMHMVGLIWAILRERYFVKMTGHQTSALTAITETIDQGTKAIRSGFKNVRLKIEHSEELTSQKRREMIQLIRDSERRCMDSIRDLSIALQLQGIHPGVTIQNSAGSGSVNQAGDNKSEQR